jgi:hypothetical protein
MSLGRKPLLSRKPTTGKKRLKSVKLQTILRAFSTCLQKAEAKIPPNTFPNSSKLSRIQWVWNDNLAKEWPNQDEKPIT